MLHYWGVIFEQLRRPWVKRREVWDGSHVHSGPGRHSQEEEVVEWET